jgi:hypothetical protein
MRALMRAPFIRAGYRLSRRNRTKSGVTGKYGNTIRSTVRLLLKNAVPCALTTIQ